MVGWTPECLLDQLREAGEHGSQAAIGIPPVTVVGPVGDHLFQIGDDQVRGGLKKI